MLQLPPQPGLGQPPLPPPLTVRPVPNTMLRYNLPPQTDYHYLINKPDSVNENSSLKDSLHGYIGDYSTETTRLIEEEEKYRDSKPETKICCFSSQNYNVVSDIKKELKNVMTKPPLYRYVFMFVPLNIIHGVAFAEIIEDHFASTNLYINYDVIYTIIFAYALSATLTGVGLLLFVRFKLRFLLDIFPKHIYNGVLGSIGIYLVLTAIKISAPNTETSDYNYRLFFHKNNFLLFSLASILANLTVFIRCKAKNNHVLVTTLSFLSIFLGFYFIAYFWSIPFGSLIEDGWIFALDNQITMSKFYSNFYFRLISWEAIGKTISTMLILVFFMILSAHIKISKFEASIDDHKMDIDRELIVQGVSNLISGIFGHFQGLILAFCISITVYFGQLFIKYIPAIVVVTMIVYLGLELIGKALIASWKFSDNYENFNMIIIIVAIMTIGFVEGIVIGIMLSYIFFLASNYKRGKMAPSNSARSSVRRHYRDQQFLKEVGGSQIHARMLQGYMFYGTMKGIEDDIKEFLIDCEQNSKPIRFLILNMCDVTGFGINAVQVLENIQKYLQRQKIYFVICGISLHGSEQVYKPLKKLSFWKDSHNDYVKVFSKYNEALEWCEDSLLGTYYAKHKPLFNNNQLVGVHHQIIPSLLKDETFYELYLKSRCKFVNILMKAFNETTNENEEFFNLLVPYFKKEILQKDSTLWSEGSNPNFMYVVEEGQLIVTQISAENNKPEQIERILPFTVVGEMGFFTDNLRRTNLVTITPCVLWGMDKPAFRSMINDKPMLGIHFMRSTMRLSVKSTNEKEEFFNSLIPYFKEEILQKDSTLWEEGSNPNFMYVVEEGQLSVTRISAENNKPEQIERILPLNVVGEMGFFTDNLRRTNLVTITPCVLWVINRFAYARMVGDNPILGFNFMRLTMKLSVERLYDYYKN
ncbi:4394_t:CDS:2 [Entrophospora sp. SA101]|nr:4394_t:CDS:2 [Entrophospora sp. SA101]